MQLRGRCPSDQYPHHAHSCSCLRTQVLHLVRKYTLMNEELQAVRAQLMQQQAHLTSSSTANLAATAEGGVDSDRRRSTSSVVQRGTHAGREEEEEERERALQQERRSEGHDEEFGAEGWGRARLSDDDGGGDAEGGGHRVPPASGSRGGSQVALEHRHSSNAGAEDAFVGVLVGGILIDRVQTGNGLRPLMPHTSVP